jgi:hypothetical protein
MAVSTQPPGHTSEEHVLGSDEPAWRQRNEKIVENVESAAIWVGVQAKAERDTQCVCLSEATVSPGKHQTWIVCALYSAITIASINLPPILHVNHV